MKHIIKVKLNQSSIQEAIQELEQYKTWINTKLEEFVRALADEGIKVIDENMAKAHYTYDAKGYRDGADTTHDAAVKLSTIGNTVHADMVVSGRDLLFIEFGAGVHYNGAAGSSPHPKGGEFGFTIGSYGKGLGKKDYWFYTDNGEKIITHGTLATMPVLKAQQTMIAKYARVARKVFKQ